MLKKILMPVTAAMLLLVSPVTLYAANNTSVGEIIDVRKKEENHVE